MSALSIRQRLGTVRANRPFFTWYLRQRRRRLRLNSGEAEARVTEAGQARDTESGQPRGSE